MTVIVFGCRWAAPVDQHKLQHLVELGYNVVSVNETAALDRDHICANFKETRGLVNVGVRIQEEVAIGNKVVAVLDHAWLQSGYYKERYGMNWLDKKASRLFQYGVTKLFLPRDKHGEMQQMLSGKRSDDIVVTRVTDEENPLFVATCNYEQEQHTRRQINGYTKPGHRFLAITRSTFSACSVSKTINSIPLPQQLTVCSTSTIAENCPKPGKQNKEKKICDNNRIAAA